MAKHILDGDLNNVVRTKVNFQDSQQSKQILGIIVHCVSVILQHKEVNFLKPCVELLKNPSSLKVSQFLSLLMFYNLQQYLPA